MTLTVYHAMSGNPIWWKNDRLYAVTMDNWDPDKPYDARTPDAAAAADDLQGRQVLVALGHPGAQGR